MMETEFQKEHQRRVREIEAEMRAEDATKITLRDFFAGCALIGYCMERAAVIGPAGMTGGDFEEVWARVDGMLKAREGE